MIVLRISYPAGVLAFCLLSHYYFFWAVDYSQTLLESHIPSLFLLFRLFDFAVDLSCVILFYYYLFT
jgi:hypothetical protein